MYVMVCPMQDPERHAAQQGSGGARGIAAGVPRVGMVLREQGRHSQRPQDSHQQLHPWDRSGGAFDRAGVCCTLDRPRKVRAVLLIARLPCNNTMCFGELSEALLLLLQVHNRSTADIKRVDARLMQLVSST
jgi:hypothetical protein